MEIDTGLFFLMLEIIGGSIFLNVISIRSRLKLIKNGYVKGKKYEFTCKSIDGSDKQ
jgi:hypothetical protein